MNKKEMLQMMEDSFKSGATNIRINFNGEKFHFEINGEVYEFLEKVNKRKKDAE